MVSRWLLAAAVLLGGAASARALPEEAATCLACHGDPEIAPKPLLDHFDESAHAALTCTACHAAAVEAPHPQKPLVDCGQCHAAEAAAFGDSVHGKALARGVEEAPACWSCHGEHTIKSPQNEESPVSRGAVSATCSSCHASERIAAKFGLPADRVQTFSKSFHGLAGSNGDAKVANCASCHGWHEVLPSSDPASRIHPSNLAHTCGQCHPGAGAGVASQPIHTALAGTGRGGSRLAELVRIFYMVLIPLTLLGMLFHNGIDWLRKTTASPKLPPLRSEGEDAELMTFSERVEHGFLVLCFVLLAYSGFVLKDSTAWWALPLSIFGEEGRRLFHRAAAAAFVGLCLHSVYVMLTPRGRERLRALLPRWRDVRDALALMRFNLGLSKVRPALPRFSYIEKAEYWALVWGSIVMVVTGALLVFHNVALARWPLWVIEVARIVHYLEAVLACLAIIVWHFYWVIYDPDVYPMNWAWLHGKAALKKGRGPEGPPPQERR